MNELTALAVLNGGRVWRLRANMTLPIMAKCVVQCAPTRVVQRPACGNLSLWNNLSHCDIDRLSYEVVFSIGCGVWNGKDTSAYLYKQHSMLAYM